MTDIFGKSWADLCDNSESSQSPLKNDETEHKQDKDDDDLYDMVFQPVKKETTFKIAAQDDLSLTSFMNNVHMVTPIKVEDNKSLNSDTSSKTVIIDEDTICSPFVKDEPLQKQNEKPLRPLVADLKGNDSRLKDIQHAKRRLTSECNTVNDPVTPEQVNKVNKKSTKHKNIHHSVESPKYAYFS